MYKFLFFCFVAAVLCCTNYKITASSLAARSGPGSTYTKKTTYAKGKVVCVVSITNGWAKLDNGYYVSGGYIAKDTSSKPKEESCTNYYTTAAVNIRSGPSTSYALVGQAKAGEQYCVYGTNNGFFKINFNGRSSCYASSKYFTTKAPAKTTTTTTTPSSISIVHTKVRDALLTSSWKNKADALTVAYDVAMEIEGAPKEFAVGLMANLAAEGNYGVVELTFAKSHKFGFKLPSRSIKAKTIADIKYLKDWTTTSQKIDGVKKGSCGFGSVQWSFERRVNFCKVCLEIMKTDADVNDTNYALAEAKFIAKEMKDSYFKTIKKYATKYGGSVEAWAEAVTDYYERPAGCDGNMSHTGSACKTRRSYARTIYNLLNSKKAF